LKEVSGSIIGVVIIINDSYFDIDENDNIWKIIFYRTLMEDSLWRKELRSMQYGTYGR